MTDEKPETPPQKPDDQPKPKGPPVHPAGDVDNPGRGNPPSPPPSNPPVEGN